MTNKEYREAHRLTEHEKAQMWQAIREPFATDQRRGVRWRPWAGGLAAAACVLAVAMLFGPDDGRGPAPDHADVAVRSSEVPAAAPPAAEPARREAIPLKPAGTLSEEMVRVDQRSPAADELAVVDVADVFVTRAQKAAPAPSTPESGGTRNPNDRPYDLVYHQHTGVNPFVATEEDALSTFALEVDDATWSVVRRYLADGHLPPPEAVRLEEMVNYLDPGLHHQGHEDFALHVDGMPSAFGEGYHLVRIGVTAREVAALDRHPAHLVFVVDVSGSMDREDRLGLVKRSLHLLVRELQEGDRVALVAYGSDARLALEPTGAEQREVILAAIDRLRTEGSTNAEAGLRLAYEVARGLERPGTITRLILCSDGVANVGRTGPGSILEAVRRAADEGITLTTVGFGMGNYNDVLMEQLADRGDGTYHYVHQAQDAERVFRENLTGTLEAMGREVKAQVAFDARLVSRWRLLGYENRDVADEDFRDDAVDAGDIGAGHTAVALYEVKLTEAALAGMAPGASLSLGEARLRWARPGHHPQAGQVTEIRRGIKTDDLATSWEQAPAHLRLLAVTAEFAEVLRESYWARGRTLTELEPLARGLAQELGTREAEELHRMLRSAAQLASDDRREPDR